MIVSRTRETVDASAACTYRKPREVCRWTVAGGEGQVSAAAQDHAHTNPGHAVTCEVRALWAWAVVEPRPESLEADAAQVLA